jgi:hypothetical protein
MKTAMQELIYEMDLIKNQLWEEGLKDKSAMISDMIKKAVNKLEKEKEQIINAHLEGWSDAYDYLKSDSNDQARQAEDYYNETYNN